MTVEVVKRYSREEIRLNRDKLYVFGDNWHRRGTGGQAKECRGELNAIGIRTKKAPTYHPDDFLTDEEFELNCYNILRDFQPLILHVLEGKTVVVPSDGVGTGIANLKENAPRTLAFIERCFVLLRTIDILAKDILTEPPPKKKKTGRPKKQPT